jgi:hypothetical protein
VATAWNDAQLRSLDHGSQLPVLRQWGERVILATPRAQGSQAAHDRFAVTPEHRILPQEDVTAEAPSTLIGGPGSAGLSSTIAGMWLFGEIFRNSGLNWSPALMLTGTMR